MEEDLWGWGRDAEWARGVAEGEGCRDERRGNSASEVGTDDGTENNNNNNNNNNNTKQHKTTTKTLVEDLNKFPKKEDPKETFKMSL